MATTNNISDSIKQTGWGNRKQELFIDGIIRSSALLSRMTVIDGVKSKAQIPIYDANLVYGSNICDLTDGTSASLVLSEKDVTVSDFTWYFSNCKNLLEGTYRSAFLRKGSMNEETLDSDLKEWLFDFFAKKNAEKAMKISIAELRAKIKADTNIVKYKFTAGEAILSKLEAMYKMFTAEMLDSLMGETDKDFKPVILMNSKTMQDYQLAVAAADKIGYAGLEAGRIPNWMAMEVVNYNQLANGEIIITNPANLLLITDDYGDTAAIQSEYQKKANSDEFYGNFKLGFDFRRADMIVYSFTDTTESTPEVRAASTTTK